LRFCRHVVREVSKEAPGIEDVMVALVQKNVDYMLLTHKHHYLHRIVDEIEARFYQRSSDKNENECNKSIAEVPEKEMSKEENGWISVTSNQQQKHKTYHNRMYVSFSEADLNRIHWQINLRMNGIPRTNPSTIKAGKYTSINAATAGD
jgi:hypothetical protein